MSVAYLYVIFTHDAIITNNFSFLYNEHYQIIESEGYHDIEKKHEANFARWFRDHIYSNGRNAKNVPKKLYNLACGPDCQVRSYRGCIVNGVKFHTKECAQTRTTQNSGGGVVRVGYDTSNNEYYGELKNVLKLHYIGRNFVYLFRVD